MTNPKKTLYIHIGAPKTGTTAIQHFLSTNNALLLEKGLFYPMMGRGFYNMQSRVNGFAAIEEEMFKEVSERFLKMEGVHSMVFSEEIFFVRVFGLLEKLQKVRHLYDFDVKIVVYFRRSVDYICGMWQESVKSGESPSDIETFLRAYTPYKKSIDLIFELGEILGNDKIIVKTYEKERWVNNNIIDDFLSIFGIKKTPDFISASNKDNAGDSRGRLEKMLFTNSEIIQRCVAKDIKRKVPLQHIYNAIIASSIYESITDNSNNAKVIDYIPDALITEICDKFYDDEAHIAQTFIGADRLFLEKYPTIYGKEKAIYTPLSEEEKHDLLHLIDAFEKAKKFKHSNQYVSIKRFVILSLCCLIPIKKLRKKARNTLLT